MLYDNFVITNDQFLQPSYRISPFGTKDIAKNKNLLISDEVDKYFNERFKNKHYIYTLSGREALNKALIELNLKNDDVVTIFTTSGNYYISSCVTNEINKICTWSRKIEKKTKVLLVNHEFGFPFENLSKLLEYKIPIIEDCAHSFLSQNQEGTVGNLGNYVIYSIPKFFPIQFGGILLSNTNTSSLKTSLTILEEIYIKKVLSNYVHFINEIKEKRIKNYRYLENQLGDLGFESRFALKETYCPGVFIFKTKNIDLNKLKIFMQYHGIECSVFYNEEAFFIPVNQNLEIIDLDYFVSLIKYFINLKE